MVGIISHGAYIPRLRLTRSAIADAHGWLNPGLKGKAQGARALANWDEDSVTMAVEAARDCLAGFDPSRVEALYAASTTFPFADRLNASIMVSALSLGHDVRASDVTGSQRAGTTALMDACMAVGSGAVRAALVGTSDSRRAKAASTQEMDFGDAGAALLVGADNPIAALRASHSLTLDFVDHFRGAGQDFDYVWEERWIRDEGFAKLVPQAVGAVLDKAGVAADRVTHFILPCTLAKVPERIAKTCGIPGEAVRSTLAMECGEAGTSHAILMLSHALEEASPGDMILVAQFGQGCNALLFEVTQAIRALPKRRGVIGSIDAGRTETNYMKLLTFKDMLAWDRGMRAEKDGKTALTVLYRKDDMITGLMGGKCRRCGTVQYPRQRICVNPNCGAVDSQDPYPFADKKARILSWSADFLTYSLDPPQHYGMVTFEEGGRLMTDFTDVDPGTVESGQEMRMVFRVKDFDEARGFRRYFWKAAPVT